MTLPSDGAVGAEGIAMFGKVMLAKAAAATLAVGAGVPALAAVTSVPAPVQAPVVTQLAAAPAPAPVVDTPTAAPVEPVGETGVAPEPAPEPAPAPEVHVVAAAPAAAEHERSRPVEIVARTVPAPPVTAPRAPQVPEHEDDGFESGQVDPEHSWEHDD